MLFFPDVYTITNMRIYVFQVRDHRIHFVRFVRRHRGELAYSGNSKSPHEEKKAIFNRVNSNTYF